MSERDKFLTEAMGELINENELLKGLLREERAYSALQFALKNAAWSRAVKAEAKIRTWI